MKSPGNSSGDRSVSMNLTPMIDVVFLLIIFFVVSGRMMQQDVSRQVPLPSAAGGEESENKETGKMVINIEQGGILYVGSREVPFEELKSLLVREKSLSVRPLEVRVRADRNLPWLQIEPVLILCAETGIGDLSFSILPK